MANLRRIHQAIKVMKRVEASSRHKFDLRSWQKRGIKRSLFSGAHSTYADSEKEATACGCVACFGGWLALSKEARAEGLTTRDDGVPFFNNELGTFGIALYLDITPTEAARLTMPDYYSCAGYNIKEADVIDRLYALLDKYDPYCESAPA